MPKYRATKYVRLSYSDAKPSDNKDADSDSVVNQSNNRAERSIKPFVIGRKNFLFANTPRGATASAVLFSLFETAKENGLNPFDYLVYVFRNAPNCDIHNNLNALDRLLPFPRNMLSAQN